MILTGRHYRIALWLCFATGLHITTSARADVEVLEAEVISVGKNWSFGFLEGPAPGQGDILYFTNRIKEPDAQRGIQRIDLSAPHKGASFVYHGDTSGLWCRGDELYATVTSKEAKSGVIAFAAIDGKKRFGAPRALVTGVVGDRVLISPNDLVCDKQGGIYFTDKKGKAIYYREPGDRGETVLVAAYLDNGSRENDKPQELNNPNGIILSPDDGVLYVTDNSNILYAPVAGPGKLGAKLKHLLPGNGITEPAYHEIAGISPKPGKGGKPGWTAQYGGNMNIDGMTIDADGVVYGAALSTGIVFGWDGKTGRLKRVIKCPGGVVNCVIAGKDRRTLFMLGSFGLASVPLTPKDGRSKQ